MNSEWFDQSLRDHSERLRLADRLRLAAKVIPVVVRPVRRRAGTRPAPDRLPAQLVRRPVTTAHRGVVHTPREAPVAGPPDRAREHRLDAIGVWSVARVALLFYLTVLMVMVVGIAVLWFIASQLGVVSNFERFMQSIGFGHFRVLSGKVVLGACLVAAAVVTMWVALTVIAAALYNVIAIPWGGVRVTLSPLADEAPLVISPNGNGNGKHRENGNGRGQSNGDAKHAGNGNAKHAGNGNGHRPALPDVRD